MAGFGQDPCIGLVSQAAYERFADSYCQAYSDLERYRATNAQMWRRSLSEAEMAAVLKLLNTPLGRRLVEGENRASAQVTGLWWEETRPQREKAVRQYKEALSSIANEQRSQGGKRTERQ
jgi:hypothetical protein